MKQVNDAKNRKRVASGKFLEPGATLYYPFMNRNNRISNSSTTTARHDCLQQQCAKQELVLFEDEDFIALNKPCGVSIGKLIVRWLLHTCRRICLHTHIEKMGRHDCAVLKTATTFRTAGKNKHRRYG